MSRTVAKLLCSCVAIIVAVTSAQAQYRRRIEREPRQVEHPAPAVPADKRDRVVTAPGAFAGRPYWLALAQCGGIYFKLNVLYTDIAVHARVVKPDPNINTEYTKKLNEAINAATVFFDGATRFLMNDRNIERDEAVLIYDGQSRAAGDRAKTVDEALAAARSCPALYAACQQAHAKECSEALAPIELRSCNAYFRESPCCSDRVRWYLLGALAARAQDSAAVPAAAAAPQDEPYQPSLSEIMAHQQERHIKLWFAGHAGNWPLADYEIGELSDGFDDVGRMLGGDIVKQHVGAPLDALQKAVDGKNSAAFAAAFDQLSAGCNACHHALDHASS